MVWKVDQNICEFEIAMHDLLFVDFLKSEDNLF